MGGGNQSTKLAEVSNLAHQKTKTGKRGNQTTTKQEAVTGDAEGTDHLGGLGNSNGVPAGKYVVGGERNGERPKP